jgi:amino acid adenylation domain-containing protein/FkbH-like protein/FkbM family methyltransferase
MYLGEVDHLGYACSNIETTIEVLKKIYLIREISPIFFDSYQNARVCYLKVDVGYNLELVSGTAVEGILAKGISIYHICYKVNNLEQSIEYLKSKGAILIRPPYPAILFNNQKVAFLETELGLVELLENSDLKKTEFRTQNQICIAGSFNITLICDFLAELNNYFNLPFQVKQVSYNQIIQTLHDESSIFHCNKSGYQFIFLRLSDTLRFTEVNKSLEDYNKILKNYCDIFLEGVAFLAQKDIRLTIYYFPEKIIRNIELKKLLKTYYKYLSERLLNYKNIFFSDVFLKFNIMKNFDFESERIGHLPYTESCTRAISLQLTRIIHSYIRKPYKVIIVDCDNTLWKGVCGECDANELKLTWANLKLQEMLVDLRKKGILICLASKNNEKDVLNVFDKNNAMHLSLKDIVCYQVNWESKSKNISRISKILNLSCDDFVFIDDNPLEIAEVSYSFPNLLCLEFPRDEKKAKHFFENSWFADVNNSSEFDEKRTLFYQSNSDRALLKQSSNNFDEFLKKLELNIMVEKISSSNFERISQLTFRTNQFNFTAIRYSTAELKDLSSKEGINLYGVTVSDRFGDYGLVGACFIKECSDELEVNSFLLSCRVLGRGIEYEVLRRIAEIAKKNHKQILKIKFIETSKNKPAYDFVQALPINAFTKYTDHIKYQCSTDDVLKIKFTPASTVEDATVEELQPAFDNIVRQRDNVIIKKVLYEPDFFKIEEVKFSLMESVTLKEVEDFLIEIWQSLLKKTINKKDNFLELGGDSLLSIRMFSHVKKRFNVEIEFSYIFHTKSLKEMALDILDKLQNQKSFTSTDMIQKAKNHVLTHTQEWLWFLDELDQKKSWHYNMPYSVRLRGELDISALEYALTEIVNRHSSLRMCITEEDYKPVPKLINTVNFLIKIFNAEGMSENSLKSILHNEFCRPFDLSKDLLIRACLYKLSKNDYLLLIVNHHIIFDGWSYRIFNSELSEFYSAFLEKREVHLKKISLDFFDYAYWHKNYVQEILPAKLKYWETQLLSLPRQNLPRYRKNRDRSHIGEYLLLKLEISLTKRIYALAARKQTSNFVVILILYGIFISQKCNNQDVLILCPVSGRQHSSTEELIGCFVNIVPFRLQIDIKKSFNENFDNNYKNIISALNNQEIPFNILLRKLNFDKKQFDSSLFQIMFAWQNTKAGVLKLPGVESSLYERGYNAARMEFILELEEDDAEIVGGIYYNTDYFLKKNIISYRNDFLDICNSCLNFDCSQIQDLLKQNKPTSYLKTEINYSPVHFKDMVTWFENTVEAFPHHSAIKSGGEIFSYQELNIISNQLAHYLKELGIASSAIVAIFLPSNHFSIIALIAIMKLGASYLPMDQFAPKNYLSVILEDAQADFLIYCDFPLENKFIPCLNLSNQIYKELKKYPSYNLEEQNRELAYIIYTSGTTGKPKGVKISHKNIMQLMASTQKEYQFNKDDVILLFHSLAFDFSVWELWSVLCYGGTLIMPNRNQVKSPEEVFDLIQSEKITIINQTPTAFKQLSLYQETISNKPLYSLRLVIFGGEQLILSDLKRFSQINPHIKFYNMYGITEVTVHATIKEISPCEMTAVSNIGIPLPGRSIYLLDEDGKLVDPNEIGEIYVGGLGISEGYHHLNEKTKELFLPDLFEPEKIMYKSGDLARIVAGELEYLGRKDSQIQRHGFRIELSGVEAILSQHDGIKFSAVNMIDGNLCAFIIPHLNKAFHFVLKNDVPKDLVFLPNGMPIYQLNKNETDFLYGEIFIEQQYFSEGIELSDSACVIDVGANIGMFAIQAGQISRNVKIYAIEPIPNVYKILKKNGQLYQLDIENFSFGISNICQKQEFTYYPKMSIMSGISANIQEEQNAIKAYLESQLGENYSALNELEMDEWLKNYLNKEVIQCDFITLSQFIKDNCIKNIDLLKIDVEKHEENVLLGIKDDDWQFIKQIIIEVQDVDSKKERITNLLKEKKFYLKQKKVGKVANSNLFTIYASKKPFSQEVVKFSCLYQYQWYNRNDFLKSIKLHLRAMLPSYMIPQYYCVVDQFPVTLTGKIDFSQFRFSKEKLDFIKEESINSENYEQDNIIEYIIKVWGNLLGHDNIQRDDNFFDIGGNSLLIIQAYMTMKKELPGNFRMIELFSCTTPRKLAERILSNNCNTRVNKPLQKDTKHDIHTNNDIAIISYAGIFPGGKDVQAYWENLIQGKNCITHFSDGDLKLHHGSEKYIKSSNFIKSCGKIDGIDLFDADFFGFTPREACLLDPQYRIFLEICWQALQFSGYNPEKAKETIGLYAGMGHSHYLDALYHFHHLKHEYGLDLVIEIGNHKDYLANRIAHKLNLTGAAVNVNTACSTSLVACIKACQSLLTYENDLVLAGGVSLILPEKYGYFHQPEGVLSKDGTCRPFSKKANGTVTSSGAGVVVLKRLSDALRDNDNIKAVIKGFAINNDGNQKVGFTAPSIIGQAKCILRAQLMAAIKPQDISYIEAHGTATKLGDPIEIEALMQVYNDKDLPKKSCVLGSVKGNIGHADSAAGIAGLLKVILMLENKKIPPTLHFEEPNEQINFEETPFYINSNLKEWHSLKPLFAAISSFGVGGTNAHMILCENKKKNQNSSISMHREHLLVISAKSELALNIIYQQIIALVFENGAAISDIAFTLQIGRQDFKYRKAWIVDQYNALTILKKFPQGNITIHTDRTELDMDINDHGINLIKLWLNGNTVDWSYLHQGCQHKRTFVPLHPLNPKSYWYNKINFSEPDNAITILETLKNLISNLFLISDIKSEDDFFNMGGDSLSALSLLEMIKQKFHVDLTLDDIYKTRNIRNIAEKITEATSELPLQVELLKNGVEDKTLILIHPLNGSIFCYENLVSKVNGWNIYGVRNESILDPEYDSIETLAKQYIKIIQSNNLKPPYILMGWSFGGSLAYEIARQFILLDIPVGHVFMIDSWCRFGGSFEDKSFVQKLFREHSDDYQNIKEGDWIKEWEIKLWQRVSILFNYKPEACNVSVTLFKANILYPELKEINDITNHWGSILRKNLSVINIEADHQSIVNIEHSCVIAEQYQHIMLNTVN